MRRGLTSFETEEGLVGGACYDAHKVSGHRRHMALAQAADAVIFGAVGGPKWDKVPYEVRPEAGLLRLRKDLGLFANLRPAICYPALADASTLKRELVEGLDIVIVRELTGGVYFGEPKTITDLGNGQKRAVDTQVYDTYEIERIARVAFELARKRDATSVTSVEKRNVMKSGVLWHEVVDQRARRASSRTWSSSHMLADTGAMQLVRRPKQFDVIVTDNLFGDVLSDVAAMLTGSLGMLPSASLGEPDAKTGKRKALYEPVHGSAPDIAGKGIANPIAMIASFAMALRYSFGHGHGGRPDRARDRRDARPRGCAPATSRRKAPRWSAPPRWATPCSLRWSGSPRSGVARQACAATPREGNDPVLSSRRFVSLGVIARVRPSDPAATGF